MRCLVVRSVLLRCSGISLSGPVGRVFLLLWCVRSVRRSFGSGMVCSVRCLRGWRRVSRRAVCLVGARVVRPGAGATALGGGEGGSVRGPGASAGRRPTGRAWPGVAGKAGGRPHSRGACCWSVRPGTVRVLRPGGGAVGRWGGGVVPCRRPFSGAGGLLSGAGRVLMGTAGRRADADRVPVDAAREAGVGLDGVQGRSHVPSAGRRRCRFLSGLPAAGTLGKVPSR